MNDLAHLPESPATENNCQTFYFFKELCIPLLEWMQVRMLQYQEGFLKYLGCKVQWFSAVQPPPFAAAPPAASSPAPAALESENVMKI